MSFEKFGRGLACGKRCMPRHQQPRYGTLLHGMLLDVSVKCTSNLNPPQYRTAGERIHLRHTDALCRLEGVYIPYWLSARVPFSTGLARTANASVARFSTIAWAALLDTLVPCDTCCSLHNILFRASPLNATAWTLLHPSQLQNACWLTIHIHCSIAYHNDTTPSRFSRTL